MRSVSFGRSDIRDKHKTAIGAACFYWPQISLIHTGRLVAAVVGGGGGGAHIHTHIRRTSTHHLAVPVASVSHDKSIFHGRPATAQIRGELWIRRPHLRGGRITSASSFLARFYCERWRKTPTKWPAIKARLNTEARTPARFLHPNGFQHSHRRARRFPRTPCSDPSLRACLRLTLRAKVDLVCLQQKG